MVSVCGSKHEDRSMCYTYGSKQLHIQFYVVGTPGRWDSGTVGAGEGAELEWVEGGDGLRNLFLICHMTGRVMKYLTALLGT